MSALPLHAPTIHLATTSVPDTLHRFFERVRLAEPPVSVEDLHFDASMTPNSEKVLLSFRAEKGDVNLLVLLSPALRRNEPTHYSADFRLRPAPADGPDFTDAPAGACEYVLDEPDCAWWAPTLDGPGRRWVYRTTDFDVVEVIVDDTTGRVLLRAANPS
jgi:hypothetical protein